MRSDELINKQSQIEYYERIKECYEVRLYWIIDKKRFMNEAEENENELLKLNTVNMLQQTEMKLKIFNLEYQQIFGQMIDEKLRIDNEKIQE